MRSTSVGWVVGLGLSGLLGCGGGDDSNASGVDLGRDHGIIRFEFARAVGETESPYPGTSRVVIEMSYMECLAGFYAANPTWAQGGADGTGVFADAAGPFGLCADDDPVAAACSVTAIEQNVTAGQSLLVEYAIEGALEDHTLAFGPLPTGGKAGCLGGQPPEVRLATGADVQGFDGSGNLVWETKSFTPDRAATGQGLNLTIRAGVP